MDTAYEQRENLRPEDTSGSGTREGRQIPAPEPYRVVETQRKSPGLAAFLSAIMPGLGQVYVGYYQRGFLHAVVFGMLITVLSWGRLDTLAPMFGTFLGFFYLYNVIDAARRASFFNRAMTGSEPFTPAEDFKSLGPGGSLLAGGLLVLFGILVLLETRFNISMEWIEEWWPLAPIALGVYLVVKAIQERRQPT